MFFLVKDKCGWERYKKFFKYYQDEVPDTLSPNTDENTYSTTAQVLCKMCDMNLVPFFQWWNWMIQLKKKKKSSKMGWYLRAT